MVCRFVTNTGLSAAPESRRVIMPMMAWSFDSPCTLDLDLEISQIGLRINNTSLQWGTRTGNAVVNY